MADEPAVAAKIVKKNTKRAREEASLEVPEDVKTAIWAEIENKKDPLAVFAAQLKKKDSLHGALAVIAHPTCGLECKNAAGETPLMLAVDAHRMDIVKALVAMKADVNAVDADGSSIVHRAASESFDDELTHLVKTGGANINAQDKLGRTPMHLAAEVGDCEIIMTISSFKPDLTIRDKKKRIPLETIQHHRYEWEFQHEEQERTIMRRLKPKGYKAPKAKTMWEWVPPGEQ